MEDSLIYLIVVVVVGLLASLLFAIQRGKGNQTAHQTEKRVNQQTVQTGWQVERRVNEMTDEPIIWLSVMSDSRSEILQLDRDNDKWGMNFTSAAGLRDGNLFFRFDDQPPIPVTWKKFAAGRRALFSEGDITPLVTKISTASTLRIQFVTLGELLTVGRFDIRGFETAAARLWPLGSLP
jgi:hypothetical protein